jgi:hypothetical protein
VSLQGVTVPPGKHAVVFEFDPRTLHAGEALSLVGVIVWAGLLLAPSNARNRRQKGLVHVDRIGQNP